LSHIGDEQEIRYQYLTLVHGHRTVNGSSGYTPALTDWLYSDDQSPLTDPARVGVGVEFVRALGVRYIVVHRGAFERPALEAALLRELEGDPRQVAAEHAFGRTVVFTLAAAPAAPREDDWRPIPAAAIHASASQSSDRLPLLFDHDRDTRWLSGAHQTGNEWIELAFAAPHRIAAVRMQTAERSFGDYPRELAIDVVEDGGTRTLFRGSVLPQFGRGFAANHTYPTIEIALPDNRARRVRLRQLGATPTLFWSIHELEVLER
jgi:F5/8 type C domain-containing protein